MVTAQTSLAIVHMLVALRNILFFRIPTQRESFSLPLEYASQIHKEDNSDPGTSYPINGLT